MIDNGGKHSSKRVVNEETSIDHEKLAKMATKQTPTYDWAKELDEFYEDAMELISDFRDAHPKTDIAVDKARKFLKSIVKTLKQEMKDQK